MSIALASIGVTICLMIASIGVLLNGQHPRTPGPGSSELETGAQLFALTKFVLPGCENVTTILPQISSTSFGVAAPEYTSTPFMPHIICQYAAAKRPIRSSDRTVYKGICGSIGELVTDISLYHIIPSCQTVAPSDFIGVCQTYDGLLVDYCLRVSRDSCPPACNITSIVNESHTVPPSTGSSVERITSVAIDSTHPIVLYGNQSVILVLLVQEPPATTHAAFPYLRLVSVSNSHAPLLPIVQQASAIQSGGFAYRMTLRLRISDIVQAGYNATLNASTTQSIPITSLEFISEGAPWRILNISTTNCTDQDTINFDLVALDPTCENTNISVVDVIAQCIASPDIIGHCCADLNISPDVLSHYLAHLIEVVYQTAGETATIDVFADGNPTGIQISTAAPFSARAVVGTDIRVCGNTTFVIRVVISTLLSHNCTPVAAPNPPTVFRLPSFNLFPDAIEFDGLTNLYFSTISAMNINIDQMYLPAVCSVGCGNNDIRTYAGGPMPRSTQDEDLPRYIAAGTLDAFTTSMWEMGIPALPIIGVATDTSLNRLNPTLLNAHFIMQETGNNKMLFVLAGGLGIPINATHMVIRNTTLQHIQCEKQSDLIAIDVTNSTVRRTSLAMWKSTALHTQHTFDSAANPLTTVQSVDKTIMAANIHSLRAMSVPTGTSVLLSQVSVANAHSYFVPSNGPTTLPYSTLVAVTMLVPGPDVTPEVIDSYFPSVGYIGHSGEMYMTTCYPLSARTMYVQPPHGIQETQGIPVILATDYTMISNNVLNFPTFFSPPMPCVGIFGVCLVPQYDCNRNFIYTTQRFNALAAYAQRDLPVVDITLLTMAFDTYPLLLERVDVSAAGESSDYIGPKTYVGTIEPNGAGTYSGTLPVSTQSCYSYQFVCEYYSVYIYQTQACFECVAPH